MQRRRRPVSLLLSRPVNVSSVPVQSKRSRRPTWGRMHHVSQLTFFLCVGVGLDPPQQF